MMTEKMITRGKSPIQQMLYKVKSGQGGFCTVVTKLTISQQLCD